MKRLSLLAATLIASLFLAGDAAADTVAYNVEPIRLPGFSASWIHPGANPRTGPDGNTYFPGGSVVYSLSGTIIGERDSGAGKVTFTGGTILATTLNKPGTLLGVYDQELNLKLNVVGGGLQRIGPRPRGFLHTTWEQRGAPTLPVTFYIADIGFAGYVNGITPDLLSFTIWANKTQDPRTHLTDVRDPVGIDLHARGRGDQQVPEPAAALLLAICAAGLFWRIRPAF